MLKYRTLAHLSFTNTIQTLRILKPLCQPAPGTAAATRPCSQITLGRLVVTRWSGFGGIQAWSRRPTGFLQCFDTVGLVIWPVKIVPEMTYYVSSGTLHPTHSLVGPRNLHLFGFRRLRDLMANIFRTKHDIDCRQSGKNVEKHTVPKFHKLWIQDHVTQYNVLCLST